MNEIAYRDELLGTSWLGEVVDVADPLKMGRCRVRVFGKFDELQAGDVPWASSGANVTAGSGSGGGFLSVPKVGSVVAVTFPNGDLYFPEYRFNQALSKEAKAEVNDSYENAHVLLYDTVTDGSLKVYFTEKKGLVLDYKGTSLNLKPDKSIKVTNPNGDYVELTNDGALTVKAAKDVTVKCENASIEASKSIHLDCSAAASVKLGSTVTDHVILGDKFVAMFNSHIHTGNIGYPTSPPLTPAGPNVLSTVVQTQ